MRALFCGCGARVFFDNTRCLACGGALAFDPQGLAMVRLPAGAQGQGTRRLCRNALEHAACNWLAEPGEAYCRSCALNRFIPALDAPGRLDWWRRIEAAKRRLVYGLIVLGLPIVGWREDPHGGLGFAFLEDRRTNPLVAEEHVLTGHRDGLITVNVAEADALVREQLRLAMGESYRTLLGHLRHESGHYYFERLVRDGPWLEAFRRAFGDERVDYGQALARHYERLAAGTIGDAWRERYITAYASAHPLEDWAETWAHYLLIVDTLETAAACGAATWPGLADFDALTAAWSGLAIALNELAASMGLDPPYPFVLSPPVLEKMRLVHRVTGPRPATT